MAWTSTCLLEFSIGKCRVINFASCSLKTTYFLKEGKNFNQVILAPLKEGDLGIIVDDKFKFTSDNHSIESTTNKLLALNKKTIASRSKKVFNKLY